MPVRRRSNEGEELSLRLGEEHIEDSLQETEERVLLRDRYEFAIGLLTDFKRAGPIAAYLDRCITDARSALRVLVSANPNDAVTIAKAQAEASELYRFVGWLQEQMVAANQSDAMLNNERGRNATQYDD